MKITNRLPQFEDKKVLFIVTGQHIAEFYEVADGEINLKKGSTIKLDKIKYFDQEGFSVRKKNLKTLGSGWVRELDKRISQAELSKAMKVNAKRIINNFKPDVIYLFAPAYFAPKLKKAVSSLTKRKIKIVKGNFSKQHPFDLIKKIR